MIVYDWIAHMVERKIWECLDLGLPLLFALTLGKCHGIVLSMSAYGPDDPGLNPHVARVHNVTILFLVCS